MSERSVAVRTRDVLMDVLGLGDDEVLETAKLYEDLGADSLDLVEVAMALEQEFNIEIPDSEVDKWDEYTVAQVSEYCEKSLGK